MKKLLLLLIPAVLVIGCDNNGSTSETTTGDSITTNSANEAVDENVTLPYAIPRPADWERGGKNHVALAMNTLRAYETNDMTGIAQYLADSVEFYTDNMEFKGSRDSLIQLFTKYRSMFDTVTVTMHDYESVKSKGRGEEWVGLWYTEVSKRKGGQVDSVMVMDDVRIINGKVAVIDSKIRKLPSKKS